MASSLFLASVLILYPIISSPLNRLLAYVDLWDKASVLKKIVDAQKVTAYNPINDKFNRSVAKCCIDITQRKIIVFIKVPRTQQTQKILKDLESQIKEEISSQNPEYIFSNFERTHNQLWLQGTKRK